jgi:hypothetical protein
MAGRYDSNPFDEDEVNPFSVSTIFPAWIPDVFLLREVFFMDVTVCDGAKMLC